MRNQINTHGRYFGTTTYALSCVGGDILEVSRLIFMLCNFILFSIGESYGSGKMGGEESGGFHKAFSFFKEDKRRYSQHRYVTTARCAAVKGNSEQVRKIWLGLTKVEASFHVCDFDLRRCRP